MDYSIRNPIANNIIYYLIQFVLTIVVIIAFILISALLYKTISGWIRPNSETFIDTNYSVCNIPQNSTQFGNNPTSPQIKLQEQSTLIQGQQLLQNSTIPHDLTFDKSTQTINPQQQVRLESIPIKDNVGYISYVSLQNLQNTLAESNAKGLNSMSIVPITTTDNNIVQVQLDQLQNILNNKSSGKNLQEAINGISSETIPHRISKSFYNKYEEIIYPSGFDPYIGRDTVAFKDMNCNQNFIKNRPFALACQVDLTTDWNLQNYDNTGTNIIRTCVYNNKSSDPDIWTRDKCISECSKIPDITNIIKANITDVTSAANNINPSIS